MRCIALALFFVVVLAASRAVAQQAADFSAAQMVLEKAVADEAFPGCVAEVGSKDGALWSAAVGNYDYTSKTPVTAETLYDLASLTKVVGTTSVVLCLVRDGKLSLDDPLEKHVGEFVSSAAEEKDREIRSRVTISNLLAHASGLPAGRPLYQVQTGYKNVIADAAKSKLAAAPGERAVYSDLGFMLLGESAARAGGKPLAKLERELVFQPLGMIETLRAPAESLWPRIAPTERVAGDEKKFHRGVVHDENSRAADGMTGHAGLFSTAADVGRYARAWLAALDGKSNVFSKELVQRFIARTGTPPGTSRALGWDTPSGRSSSGSKMPGAFGHTGFTGTSLWIDPKRGVYVVLLSNRVHPTRANQKIGNVRRALADAAMEAVDAANERKTRPTN